MKNHELPCYLVEDLLPLYVDRLVNSQTQNDIQLHLSHCKSCSSKYQSMTESMEAPKQAVQTADASGIQFLKKERRMGHYKIIAAMACCLALFLGIFYWGVIRQYAFDFEVENLYQLANGSIYFELVPPDEESAITTISYRDGIAPDQTCYEIQMGYSLLSLWQGQKNSFGGRIYCFVLTPEPNQDKTGCLPIYYTQGSTKLLIWDGVEELPTAPEEVEQNALHTISPFSIRSNS